MIPISLPCLVLMLALPFTTVSFAFWYAFLVIFSLSGHDVPGKWNWLKSAFNTVVIRCGDGKALQSPEFRSEAFSEPMPLDCEPQKCFSFIFLSPKWDRIARVGWSCIFPFTQFSYVLIIPQHVRFWLTTSEGTPC